MTAAVASSPPLVDGQPADTEGPVFREPWEASAFALAVTLSKAGYFTWAEWVGCFSTHIKASDDEYRQRQALDRGQTYYKTWFEALEHLLEGKGILAHDLIEDRFAWLKANPAPHDHVAKREPVCVA